MSEKPWTEESSGSEAHLGRAGSALSLLECQQVMNFQEGIPSQDPVVVKLKDSSNGDAVVGGWGNSLIRASHT